MQIEARSWLYHVLLTNGKVLEGYVHGLSYNQAMTHLRHSIENVESVRLVPYVGTKPNAPQPVTRVTQAALPKPSKTLADVLQAVSWAGDYKLVCIAKKE